MSAGWDAVATLLGCLVVVHSSLAAEVPCTLPDAWGGAWFLSGRQERVLVTARTLGWLGSCHATREGNTREGNKFVLRRSRDNCFQCLAILLRHANALQFKAGECRETDTDLDSLCNIASDVTLNTMVRLDSNPIDCPFKGPVKFSYNKGTGQCSSPLSEMLQCMTPGQLKLRFHACPDIQQTESRGWLSHP